MAKLPTGKGFFIWIVDDCEGGDIAAIVREAVAAGVRHVLIKIANGILPYNGDISALAAALQAAGIDAWGWTYVFGYDATREAAIAADRTVQFNLAGLVVNAEAEMKKAGMGKFATALMSNIRARLGPSTPVGLSSYRYPSYHPEFPWREFLGAVDFNMPQVYWMGSTNAGAQLKRSIAEFEAMPIRRPIIPTGAAFKEHGWAAKPAEVLEFLNVAKELGFSGVNFWEWGRTRRDLPANWDVIAKYPWPAGASVPTAPPAPAFPRAVIIDTIAGRNLNIRSVPNGDIIGVALRGSAWTVTGETLDAGGLRWYSIADGAYMAAWLCRDRE